MYLKTAVRRLLHPGTCSDHVRDLDGSLLWCARPKGHEVDAAQSHRAMNGVHWNRRSSNGILRIVHPEDLYESEQARHRKEMKLLRGDLHWMLDTATDEQLLAWAEDAGRHVVEMEDTDPSWVNRYADQLTHMGLRLRDMQSRLDQAVNDQDWDIKISGIGDCVQVVGNIPREQVPALLYRMAAMYGEEQEISTEESLRKEAERFRKERNEAREMLAGLKGEGMDGAPEEAGPGPGS